MGPIKKLDSHKKLDYREHFRAFSDIARAKGWQALHTPANLASALAVESAELLAEFQRAGEPDQARVGAEVADVALYLFALCQALGLDLDAEIRRKMAHNRARFLTDESVLGPGGPAGSPFQDSL